MDTLRILLAAGLEEDALQIQRLFRQAGLEASARHEASIEGLRKAMGENAWDAVVAICGAGGFTGTDILQEVRSRNPGLPVLVVSGTSAAGRPVASLMKVLTAMGREEIRPVPGPHGNAANKTTPAGLVAHDFGNILTAIIGFAEMANLEIDGKSPAKKNIAEILSAGERARGLFDRILALNR